MNKLLIGLLAVLVVIAAIGVGLYANELSRQADQRRAAVKAAKEAELNDEIHTWNRAIERYCHPGSENVKANVNAKPGSPELDKASCESNRSMLEDSLEALKKLQEENP